jgi:hypothetical protein
MSPCAPSTDHSHHARVVAHGTSQPVLRLPLLRRHARGYGREANSKEQSYG